MSIFKDTLKTELQNQLKVRQEALLTRTPAAIQYLNSRSAWVRMSSSVNVKGSNELAKKYILLGGTLSDNKLRSGIGTADQAYSTSSPGGTLHRLGIRPMPGINSIDVKSKSAYGSLREVEVKFTAWDIKQLEDLELLYMRPGYTVLVEWGWNSYLNDINTLQANNTNFYDIINKTPSKDQIFKDLYDTAVKKYSGNYDAMFGYVKNYSWSARGDGGYDCTTSIISLGEVVESLKINYSPFNSIYNITKTGLIAPKVEGITISDLPDIKKIYSKNILAGLFYELYTIGMIKMPGTQDEGKNLTIKDYAKDGSPVYYDLFKKTIDISGGEGESSSDNTIGASDEQVYITLEGLCNLINTHVTFTDSKGKQSFVKCSVLDREYLTANSGSNPLTGDGYLLCLAHPLQISVDPTVCLINSPIWPSGFKINPDTIVPSNSTNPNLITFPNSKLSDKEIDDLLDQLYYISIPTKTIKNKQAIVNYIKQKTQQDPDTVKALSKRHFEKLKDTSYKVKRPAKVDLVLDAIDEGSNIDGTRYNKTLIASGVGSQASLYAFLTQSFLTNLDKKQVDEAFGPSTPFIISNPVVAQQAEINEEKQKLQAAQEKTIEDLEYLTKIKRPYFYKDTQQIGTELGIIGNIYVNLNYLFRLILDNDLESLDTKEKKDINLYDFLKNVLSEVSSAIGNVSNFDLYVDPIDSKIYIIDINYVDTVKSRAEVYKNIFQLELHNLKSTVRSYKLESQIFPDQSTIVAIGAQVGGGAMATDNNTMLDFNKGLEDRIIGKKEDPTIDPNQPDIEKIKSQLQSVSEALKSLYEFFGDQDYGVFSDANFDSDKAADYKNALKDLINFFKNLTKCDIKNRSIIPTKLSITLDGIGGLVIGHLFKIPEELLPKGYQNKEAIGSKLGYTITGIGHSLTKNDWTTNIDAQTIILDEPQGSNTFYDVIELNPETNEVTTKSAENIAAGGTVKNICGEARKNGNIEDILVEIKPNLYKIHYSSENKSDNKRIRLQPNAMKDLEAMLTAAYNAGVYLKVNSAYRTYDDQVRIKKEAKGVPAASPGTSNHGFGLAVDLANANGKRVNPIETPKEWAWIQANKAKYGFNNINNTNESHHYNYTKSGTNC